jgi:hypothetical protein
MATKKEKRAIGEAKEAERLAQRDAAIARLEKRRRAKRMLRDQAQRRVANARAAAAIHRASADPTAGATPSDASASPATAPPADPGEPLGEPTPPGTTDD